MNRQIVHVLSTNYAGSHLLALQLGSHSRCASLGELHHLRKKGARRTKKVCYLCESDSVCPVLGGLDHLPVSAFYGRIFANLESHNPQVATVIDNSKKPRWASRFVAMPGYTQKYVHLIRDPRALIRRWILSYDTPAVKREMRIKTARRCWRHCWQILRGDEPNVYIWNWLYENRLITDFLRSNELDWQLVTYYDLVFRTDEVLSRLMAWLGLEYEPSQKEYWTFVHHGSVKPDYMRPAVAGAASFDQRWKTFLDEETQKRVVEHPQIRAYLGEIGLVLGDNELVLQPVAAERGGT